MDALTARFRELHQSGCFVIANPWDPGTAKYLEHLGFPALATTSGGFAFSRGLPDGGHVGLDDVLQHIADIVHATALPVNADFEAGYAGTAEGVAANVTRCIATGVAGLSIEDATGDPARPLFELEEALDRLRAAREAIDESGTGVLLTARAECYLVRHAAPFDESVRRLQAYAEAGADVLFAPGVGTADEIKALVAAVHPKPFNLIVTRSIGLTVAEIAALGVRRISLGSALARSAWGAFMGAAQEVAQGSFAAFDQAAPYPLVNGFFQGTRN